eukprot:s3069_g13.t1
MATARKSGDAYALMSSTRKIETVRRPSPSCCRMLASTMNDVVPWHCDVHPASVPIYQETMVDGMDISGFPMNAIQNVTVVQDVAWPGGHAVPMGLVGAPAQLQLRVSALRAVPRKRLVQSLRKDGRGSLRVKLGVDIGT